MSDAAAEAIAATAAGPKRIRTELGDVEGHSISDQIAADRYRRQCSSTGSGTSPLKRLRKATVRFGVDA